MHKLQKENGKHCMKKFKVAASEGLNKFKKIYLDLKRY